MKIEKIDLKQSLKSHGIPWERKFGDDTIRYPPDTVNVSNK